MIFSPPGGPSRVWQAVANLYVLLAGLFVLWSAAFALLFQMDVLVRDQWHVYVDFFRMPFWQGLWHDQNGHRLLFPNLFFHLDNYAFQGTNTFLQVCILLMNAATGYLLLPSRSPNPAINPQLVKMSGGFVFVLLFWLANRTDLVWGLGVHYYLPALTAVASCRLVAYMGPDLDRPGSFPKDYWKVALAILCGVVTTFSFGIGMAIWPALIILAWLRKLRLNHLAVITAAAVIFVAVYALNMPKSPRGLGVLPAPWKILIFVGAHVGSPVAHALRFEIPLSSETSLILSSVVGISGALAAGFLGVRGLSRQTPMKSEDAFRLSVVFFVLCGSVLIALGRVERFGFGGALSPRYLIWSLLAWAAAVAAVPRLCSQLDSRRRLGQGLAGILIVILTVLLLPTHYKKTIELGFASNRAKEAGLSLIVGVKDESMVIPWLYRLPKVVEEVAAVLRSNRWNLFSDRRLDLLENPLPAAGGSEPLVCRGGLIDAEPLPVEGDWRLTGWAWQEGLRTPPQYVLLADGADVRGLAEFTRGSLPHREAREIYSRELRYWTLRRLSHLWPRLFRWDLGWYGYVKGVPDICQLDAYGLFEDGRTLCVLPKLCAEGQK